jgi:predicted RND superfamily exporter protein
MKKLFQFIVRILLKLYPLVLLLGVLLAVLSLPRVTLLFKNLSTDPVDLLPEKYQSVQTLLKIRDKVANQNRFGVVFESDHPENTKRLLGDLEPILAAEPLVGKVYITKPGFDFFDKNKLLFIELADLHEIHDRIDRRIQREKLGGLYISFEEEEENDKFSFTDLEDKYREKYGQDVTESYYISPNGKVFALYVEGKKENMSIAEEKAFQDAVKKRVDAFDYKSYDPTMKLYFGGSTRVMEYRALIGDLKTAGIISGIVIFLPILIRFRRPQYVLLIFLPLLIGVPSGMALASFWVPRLNVTTSFLFAILGGLGVETGIHIFSRYYEKRKEGASMEDSLLDIYLFLGRPVLTAVSVLATTFLLMIFSDFRGFSEFGFISGLGLWTVFILYFTFFPALLIFAEKTHLLKFKSAVDEWRGTLNVSPGFVKTLLVIFTLFTAFSVAVIPKIKFEYNSKKIRADDPRERLAKIKQRMTTGSRVNSPAAVLIDGEANAKLLKSVMDRKKAENPQTTIDYTSSIYSLVPEQQEEKLKVIGDIDALLADDSLKLVEEEDEKDLARFREELKKPHPFASKDVPEAVKEVFVGKQEIPGSLFLIFAKPHLELDDGRNAIRFAEEIKEITTPEGVYHASSSAVVFADVLSTMLKDSKKILMIAVLSVLFFVYLDLRSFKKTALVMFSILAGVLWVMGVMYLLRIKLNMYNMVMIPAVMGMSVDNSIHIYHRYEELGRGSLSKVLSSTGIASMLASLTNAAGFIGLAFCTHGGLRSMGLVAVTGLATCLITTLVFLPMTLQYLEWRRRD